MVRSQMNIFTQSNLQIKQEIRDRYLAGDSIPSIARHYKVSVRDIYYHLDKLTADEKGLHAKNSSLKQTLRKEGHAAGVANKDIDEFLK